LEWEECIGDLGERFQTRIRAGVFESRIGPYPTHYVDRFSMGAYSGVSVRGEPNIDCI